MECAGLYVIKFYEQLLVDPIYPLQKVKYCIFKKFL